MNRIIKFRAWTGLTMEYNIVVGKFGAFYVNPSKKGDGLSETDSASLTNANTKYPEETPVMQFTGLTDKNGKEIYEGDVVRETVDVAQITHKTNYKTNPASTDTFYGKYETKTEEHPIEWGSYDDGEYVSDIQCWKWGSYSSLSDRIGYPEENNTSYWHYKNRKFEVIGNIYENPELLETANIKE